MLRLRLCTLLAGLALFLAGGVQAQTVAPSDPPFWFGACVHFGQNKGIPAENISLMKQAGLNTLRDELYWRTLETQKGQLRIPSGYDDFVRIGDELGVTPHIILSYGNSLYDGGHYLTTEEAYQGFLNYCRYVINRYKGRVKVYEVWNEWSGLPKQKNNEAPPERYAEFLNRIIPELRKVDPQAKFIAGWRDDNWYTRFAAAGGLKSLDGYVAHPYQYGYPASIRRPEAWLTRVQKLIGQLKQDNGGKTVPLYINEVGWPGQIDNRGSSPQMQADYLARSFILARTVPEVRGMWWYDFQDDGYNHKYNEDNFGIIRPDLTPEPAYMALKDLGSWIINATYLGRVETNDPDVWILRWKDAAGKDLWTCWYAALDNQAQITFKRPSTVDSAFTLTHVGRGTIERKWGSRDWARKEERNLSPTTFKVTLDRTPWIVRGDMSGVSVEKITPIDFPELNRPGATVSMTPKELYLAYPVASADQYKPADGKWTAINQWVPLDPKEGKVGALSARMAAAYTAEELVLHVEVKDPVVRQDYALNELWMGDSVQVAFHDFNAGKNSDGMTELSFGLGPKGPLAYRELDQFGMSAGPLSHANVRITRDDAAGTTTYRLRIPVTVFASKKLVSGSFVGMSVAVNDNDGKTRRGALCWGREPLVLFKNPSSFNWIVLAP